MANRRKTRVERALKLKSANIARILAEDGVDEILDLIHEDSKRIENLITITIRENGDLEIITTGMTDDEVLATMERMKFRILCYEEEV